jgi:hypothetical protein
MAATDTGQRGVDLGPARLGARKPRRSIGRELSPWMLARMKGRIATMILEITSFRSP